MSNAESQFIKVENESGKISFQDDYEQQCSLQKSNATLENKIWFRVDKDNNGKAVNAHMHLTQEQVKTILSFL